MDVPRINGKFGGVFVGERVGRVVGAEVVFCDRTDDVKITSTKMSKFFKIILYICDNSHKLLKNNVLAK